MSEQCQMVMCVVQSSENTTSVLKFSEYYQSWRRRMEREVAIFFSLSTFLRTSLSTFFRTFLRTFSYFSDSKPYSNGRLVLGGAHPRLATFGDSGGASRTGAE